ncbi:phosphate regulon sensor histidine kinase PhoR [Candidatus Enterovibrio escicola]|uniref:Phosphate regulon sensor protein PhoR n=1 Tax=Candidatus Enterovibrio escicola TaxID=1927127 RepID=A0A2A5T6G3_9GAMM|nr:phosphate regulon sensor histidine kinase PhoR [Candidatus Enterovibrio escacola]PCS23743.1 Phosphate regulon sensor protein PhoR [Candidatus Enterovibrio escacola]
MVERLTWKKLALELAFFYLPWLIIGWFFGGLTWLLLLATVLVLLWNFYHQLKLSDWLWKERSLTYPSRLGNWTPLFNDIHRLQKRNRRHRKELANFIRRFRNGAESLPDAVVVFEYEGSIVWCNKLAQELLGFRMPDDAGQYIANLIRTPEFIEYLARAEFCDAFEMRSPLHASNTLEFRTMHYAVGEYLMVVRDITQLKQLEGMRRNFFANVSHELRTPMTVLRGYLEMSEDPGILVGSMWVKAHEVMIEQLSRMEGLVEQLLTLSKIEASIKIALDQQVDVPTMLDALEKEARTLSGNRAHVFKFDIDYSLKVLGDEDQLRSAISNLVYNAVKHTPSGADIKVLWFLSPKGPRLEVIDTGEGIESRHIDRLTERFYRVDKARSRQTGGSGLGLAIVKHSLNHHESELEIKSKVGKGSVFSFTLPESLIC